MTFTSIAFGLVSGFVGWMLTEFLAKPFRKGIDLIADAQTLTIVYANVNSVGIYGINRHRARSNLEAKLRVGDYGKSPG